MPIDSFEIHGKYVEFIFYNDHEWENTMTYLNKKSVADSSPNQR